VGLIDVLGITPARGGSKGLPRKNIRPLSGKPLLEWTIEAARAATLLDSYVVSTEDKQIAAAARQAGAEVLDRPAELATDEATTMAVLQHALELVPAKTVVLLQATSPIRRAGLIDECIKRFRSSGADSLATGFTCKLAEYGSPASRVRRQEAPGFFVDDGSVYVIRADLLRAGDRYGSRMERFETSRVENIDIDDAFDFWLAEQVLQARTSTARVPDFLA